MAKIVFINPLSRMLQATGYLMGALRDAGHDAHTIRFKTQEGMLVDDLEKSTEFELSDYPQRQYILRNQDLVKQDISCWKKISPLERDNLVAVVREQQPDAIGITTLSHSMTLCRQIVAILREHFDVPIMLGGVGAITEPDVAISFTDLICTGEGEQVIVEIADRLDQGKSLEGIVGTHFRLPDGSIQKNPKAPLTDLSTLLMPDYSPSKNTYINGIRCERNVRHNHRLNPETFIIMTQRGCPFSCAFCIESFLQEEFGRKDHLRRVTPERALAELRYAKNELGCTRVEFWDDVFPLNPAWLDEFLPRYKEEIGLPFFCYTYPSVTKPSILKQLYEAGCVSIGMGVQSGSDRILVDAFDRPTNKQLVQKAIKNLAESGINRVDVDLIPKTPWDNEEDLYQTLQLMLDLPRHLNPTFYNELILFPNYPIHKRVEEKNLISSSGNGLTEELYLFYLKLMVMTRLNYDRDFVESLHKDPACRADHNLLNQYLLTEEELHRVGYFKQFNQRVAEKPKVVQ